MHSRIYRIYIPRYSDALFTILIAGSDSTPVITSRHMKSYAGIVPGIKYYPLKFYCSGSDNVSGAKFLSLMKNIRLNSQEWTWNLNEESFYRLSQIGNPIPMSDLSYSAPEKNFLLHWYILECRMKIFSSLHSSKYKLGFDSCVIINAWLVIAMK